MSPEVFTLLSALVEESAGLHYPVRDKDLLGEKLAARAAEAGFDSLLDYYYYLRYDPNGPVELDDLVDALVVGETYLFRELQPLVVLVDELVAPRVAAKQRPRIWSAACATGEEPLTIAMLLADRGLLDGVELVASDVSRRALERARAGSFGARSLRSHVPIPAFAWRFMEERDGRVVVGPELVQTISWRRVNLIDAPAVAALGRFDAIVCRNVLIYFRDDVARRVVDTLTAALRPGGVLIVGISESLLRLGTALSCEERGGAFVYRKVA